LVSIAGRQILAGQAGRAPVVDDPILLVVTDGQQRV